MSLRYPFRLLAALSIAVLGISAAHAQTRLTENTLRRDAAAPPRTATFDEVSFLVGHWIGEAFGGTVEEMWGPELGGSMLGAFKLVVDGTVEFQEVMTLRRDSAAGLALAVKHFDAQLKAWEEKDEMITFPFIRSEGSRAYFSGLTFERTGPDALTIYLAMRQEDGTTEEVVMRLKKG
jgi:hypothetical protein